MSILRTPSTHLMRTLMVTGTLATAASATADVVTDWNEKTVAYVNAAGRPAPAWILDLAMVHIAMHDAIQAYQHRFETYNDPIAGAAGSAVAAAATAARDVLVNRFPAQEDRHRSGVPGLPGQQATAGDRSGSLRWPTGCARDHQPAQQRWRIPDGPGGVHWRH